MRSSLCTSAPFATISHSLCRRALCARPFSNGTTATHQTRERRCRNLRSNEYFVAQRHHFDVIINFHVKKLWKIRVCKTQFGWDRGSAAEKGLILKFLAERVWQATISNETELFWNSFCVFVCHWKVQGWIRKNKFSTLGSFTQCDEWRFQIEQNGIVLV